VKQFILVLSILLFGIHSSLSNAVENVSIVSLISNAEHYKDQEVLVHGVVGITQGESNLYLDKWSFEHMAKANSICLQINRNDDFGSFHSSPSIVYGTLSKNEYCGYVIVVKNIAVAFSREALK